MNKIQKIYNLLLNKFGPQGWWPINNKYNINNKETIPKEQLEIILGAILTQNTSWKNVEKALKNLKNNNLLIKNNLEKIETDKLSKIIKPSGYHNQKAKKIKEFLKFKETLTRTNLLNIWGIGPETADSILLYAYNQAYFVIDAYTKRIFQRLGFKENTYKELQNLFHTNLEKDHKIFNEYHALIVQLAKTNCKKTPECSTCPLKTLCLHPSTFSNKI